MHVGVIASLKRGFEHFIYREVVLFERAGAKVSIFPTKSRRGDYNPHANWSVHAWNVLSVMLWQPYFLVRFFRRYVRLLAEAVRLRATVDFAVAWYFSRYLQDVDVLYATFGDHKLFVGYFCKKISGKPLAVTVHAYELYANPNPRMFAEALKACDQIITVSEHNREYLGTHFGIPADSIEVVRYSIDVDEYHPEREFVILIVAFFVERKGHEILLRAVKQLNDETIKVWVVGDEGAEQTSVDVRAIVEDLQISSQVAFLGRLNGAALKSVYRACDVFCLPCRFDRTGVGEGFPNVIIEAMALGKPVITTRHVEIPRVLDEVLVDENDVDGLAAAILRLQNSPELRHQLGERNRQLAVKLFSPTNAEQTLSLLQRAQTNGMNGSPRSAETQPSRRTPSPDAVLTS